MTRYSNIDGVMVKNPDGGWAQFSNINGTENEMREWIYKYAIHPPFPDCKIRKTKECTCGLNKFISNLNQ